MNPELRTEIDNELTQFQALTTEVEALESEVAGRMRQYEELLNSYVQGLQMIQPKMDAWRGPRREKTSQLVERLRAKWADLRTVLRTKQDLDQEERYFSAVLSMQYKKPDEQKAFQKRRMRLIQAELGKIQLPGR
jgi:hypothetical protein